MRIRAYLTTLKSIYNLNIKSRLNTLSTRYFTSIISSYCVTKTLIIRLNRNLNFLQINKDCKLNFVLLIYLFAQAICIQ